MEKFFSGVGIGIVLFLQPLSLTHAAMVRSEESVYIPENQTDLRDLYVFGGSITIDAPVENDLVTAGGDVTLNSDVTGGLMAAAGDLVIRSHVNQTARVAGGNITLSGKIDRDFLVTGGSVLITKDASISGDLLFFGGELRVEGPVGGKIYANGGEVLINSSIEGNVEGNFAELRLGKNAVVNGDLRYTASEKAIVEDGAVLQGQHHFSKMQAKEQPTGLRKAFTTGALYKLITDIVICLLLVAFLPRFVQTTIEESTTSPASAAGIGFLTAVALPLISIFLLMLIWLGLASFLLYGLLLLTALFITKLILGWWVLHWWNKRNRKDYVLDWKVAVVGPLLLFTLAFIPVVGWLILFVVYLMALGGLTRYLMNFAKNQRLQTEKH